MSFIFYFEFILHFLEQIKTLNILKINTIVRYFLFNANAVEKIIKK